MRGLGLGLGLQLGTADPLAEALRDAIDIGTAGVDTDDRATATTSPFTLDEVASGALVQQTVAMGGMSLVRTACDDAVTNLLAGAELAGTADTEATPTGWTWGGSYTTYGRRWIRSSAFAGKQAVELVSGSQRGFIEQTVSGLTIGVDYTVQVYVELAECVNPQQIIGVDGAVIDAEGQIYAGKTGWHWATFTATSTSHDIALGVGIGGGQSYARLILSMPIMTAGTTPALWVEDSRSAQTVTLDVDGLLGESLDSGYRLMTATWTYDNSGASQVAVAFSDGAGQTAVTIDAGKATLLLAKDGGWSSAEESALTAAVQALPRLAGYRSPTASVPAVVEWGDSTTSAGQDESTPPLDWCQLRLPTVTMRSEGAGGETSAQIESRMVAASADGYKNWAVVINAGANDINNDVPVATIMGNIADMVAHIGHGRYLVRTPLRNTGWSAARNNAHAELVADIQSTYGGQVVPVYETMADDYKDDAIHPNSQGYQIIADLIADALESQGWLADRHTAGTATPDADAWAAHSDTSWTSNDTGQRRSADLALAEFEQCLRDYGLWSGIDQMLPFAGDTLTSALVPLKGTAPTNVNFDVADYGEEVGLTGDGSTTYLDTGHQVPSAANHLMAIHGNGFNVSGGEVCYCGNDERDAGRRQYLLEHYNNARRFAAHSGTLATQGETETDGMMVLTAYESGPGECFGDGSSPRSQSQTEYASNRNIGINARRRNASVDAYSDHTNFLYMYADGFGVRGHQQLLLKRAANRLARRLGRLSTMAR